MTNTAESAAPPTGTVGEVPTTSATSLGGRIGRMAAIIAGKGYPAGDRAALKRHAPGQPPPLAFYRLWLRHLDVELPGDDHVQSWATIAWGLALCGSAAHRPGQGFGRALAESGCAELRLERLLGARDEEGRIRLFASLVRILAAKGAGFDWLDAARLLLTVDSVRREYVHRTIAADYYRHLPRHAKE